MGKINLQELSSAVGTKTEKEAIAKGKKLLALVKFGKWKIRTWSRHIDARDYWHYELRMEEVPVVLYIGGSQGRSKSPLCFYADVKMPDIDVMIGWGKEYLNPRDAVMAAYLEYKRKVTLHTEALEIMKRNLKGIQA
jgi:hypothetical protein